MKGEHCSPLRTICCSVVGRCLGAAVWHNDVFANSASVALSFSLKSFERVVGKTFEKVFPTRIPYASLPHARARS